VCVSMMERTRESNFEGQGTEAVGCGPGHRKPSSICDGLNLLDGRVCGGSVFSNSASPSGAFVGWRWQRWWFVPRRWRPAIYCRERVCPEDIVWWVLHSGA